MAKLFEKNYLEEEVGLPSSRSAPLAEAIEQLHKSLCALDRINMGRVQKCGLNELLYQYAKIEEVRIIDMNSIE